MPILPPLEPFFTAMLSSPNAGPDRPIPEARAAMHAMIDASFGALLPKHPPAPVERDHAIQVSGGTISVRVYSPEPTGSPLPCHLLIHGGGFWLGTLDQSNPAARGLVAQVGCVVVSVDYRLAPEHKFPTQLEDTYAALLWLVSNAQQLGIDVSRVSVGGASAGATLAAATALVARDRNGPSLVLQVLEIPVVDFTDPDPLCMTDDGVKVPSGKEQYRGYYLSKLSDASLPYASPLLAEDFSRLPPAIVMCAQYDPLRVEGEAYAKKLAAAGIKVVSRTWEGQFHGSQHLAALIPDEVAAYETQIAHGLKRAYAKKD